MLNDLWLSAYLSGLQLVATLDTFQQELLRGALTLAAGALIARLGLAYYFRQKEHEIVKQRYLEQSVDVIAAELDSVARTFSHNWARALEVLRLYREIPQSEFDLAELKNGFLELRSTNFQRIAHHRLGYHSVKHHLGSIPTSAISPQHP